MKKMRFFLIKIVLLVVFAICIALYARLLLRESEYSTLKIVAFLVIVVTVALSWAFIMFYKLANRIESDTLLKLENMDRMLQEIRDGTKHLFKEKRQAFRVKTDMIARFTDRVLGDDFVKISDISFNGAFIKTAHELHTAEHIKLDIHLPFFPQPISVKAKVIRVQTTKEIKGASALFEAGVTFTDISAHDRQKLIETIDLLVRTSQKK
jgi:hypothetical protein